MASDLGVKTFLKDGKNGTSLLCQRCSSIILRPNLAVFTEKEVIIDFDNFVLYCFGRSRRVSVNTTSTHRRPVFVDCHSRRRCAFLV